MLDSVALRDIKLGEEIFVSYKTGDHSETLEVRPPAVSATRSFRSVSASSGGVLTRAFVNIGCAACHRGANTCKNGMASSAGAVTARPTSADIVYPCEA